MLKLLHILATRVGWRLLVGEFDEEKEEWRLYVERMEHYLNANEIQDKSSNKCEVFLSTRSAGIQTPQ